MLYPDSWMTTLPMMCIGMAGIFAVIGVIVAAMYLLGWLTKKK